jgi:hypothetical protein
MAQRERAAEMADDLRNPEESRSEEIRRLETQGLLPRPFGGRGLGLNDGRYVRGDPAVTRKSHGASQQRRTADRRFFRWARPCTALSRP